MYKVRLAKMSLLFRKKHIPVHDDTNWRRGSQLSVIITKKITPLTFSLLSKNLSCVLSARQVAYDSFRRRAYKAEALK